MKPKHHTRKMRPMRLEGAASLDLYRAQLERNLSELADQIAVLWKVTGWQCEAFERAISTCNIQGRPPGEEN